MSYFHMVLLTLEIQCIHSFPIIERATFQHHSKFERDGNPLLETHRKVEKCKKSPLASCL